MQKQTSDEQPKALSPADFPMGSPESRAAARMMARGQCKGHVYLTSAEAKASAEAHKAGLVACPFGTDLPFLVLDIGDTDAVAG